MPPRITSIHCRELEHSPPSPEEGAEGPSPLSGRTGGTDKVLVRIETDEGDFGEYVSRAVPPRHGIGDIRSIADRLLGASAFDRERLWSLATYDLRKYDAVGLGLIDIALWDLAGRRYGAPIHELLGTYRHRIPAYATPTHGDDRALDSPAAFAKFAETCRDAGFHGYKIHTWSYDDGTYDLERDIATVRAVGEAVGTDMALMLDLSGKYETMADVLAIASVCADYGYRWIEDPYGGSARSLEGYRRLRDRIEVPLLQLEHVRGVQPHLDFVVGDATDFVRVDPELDGGITGAIKIGRAAEALGADVEVHASGPARRHCLATMKHARFYEINQLYPGLDDPHPPFYAGGYGDGIAAIDADGHVPVPSGPGIGVDLDRDAIETQTVAEHTFTA